MPSPPVDPVNVFLKLPIDQTKEAQIIIDNVKRLEVYSIPDRSVARKISSHPAFNKAELQITNKYVSLRAEIPDTTYNFEVQNDFRRYFSIHSHGI